MEPVVTGGSWVAEDGPLCLIGRLLGDEKQQGLVGLFEQSMGNCANTMVCLAGAASAQYKLNRHNKVLRKTGDSMHLLFYHRDSFFQVRFLKRGQNSKNYLPASGIFK